ncbi:MAG TPA: thioesterase family protein [Sphingomonas sp.]|jgi:acyl-CoA thioesterase|uniref:acyl-CoA thioesterase n=1 Tax=Sphingomonas sp. TaxID=28214 RepID=UPI002EDA13A2
MTGLATLLAALEPIEGGWRGHIPDNWLQGRTAYGGLSTALALHAAKASDEDLPALRSAQISFIGPLAGDVTVRATRLRRGRNAAFIQADVESEAGLGLRAVFVFMRDQVSKIDRAAGNRPDFARPGPDDRVYSGTERAGVPGFLTNFEFVDRREPGEHPAEWLRWVRVKDRAGLDPEVELALIGDCLPPAAMQLMHDFVPLSSMTWLLNLLGPVPATDDGWWLLSARTDYARAGSSSQAMGIWSADGTPVAEQMQSVAIFG